MAVGKKKGGGGIFFPQTDKHYSLSQLKKIKAWNQRSPIK